jgi:hypothetical protein
MTLCLRNRPTHRYVSQRVTSRLRHAAPPRAGGLRVSRQTDGEFFGGVPRCPNFLFRSFAFGDVAVTEDEAATTGGRWSRAAGFTGNERRVLRLSARRSRSRETGRPEV